MEAVIDRDCSALGGLFQTVIGDMKSSYPIWEDFIAKAGKLQSQLRSTVVAVAVFLDAFQKVADLATSSRGGTRDIGSALTRMCLRHRSIEAKLKQFSMTFLEDLINPLQEQMEEWKRGVHTLDKDHAKEYKRARQEIKKKSSDTLKLQKKAKKADNLGRGEIQPQLDSAIQDVSDKYLLLEETEKQALRKALIEERQRFCWFVAVLRPVVMGGVKYSSSLGFSNIQDEEISMLGEVTHLQAISDDLTALTSDPHKLPAASEQVILDVKGSDCGWSYQTPPSSPSTTMSRKSSLCSSLNSVNSSDSRGSSGSHSHSPSSSSSSSSSHLLFHHHHPRHRHRSSTLPQPAPLRLSSISSHDSGFISSSHDQHVSSKWSSPLQTETKSCPTSSSSEMLENRPFASDCSSSPAPAAPAQLSTDQLSNGYDSYSSYLHTNGGSLVSGTAFPYFSSPSSSSTATSCPTRSWSRPPSALLPDSPHYCTMGSPMMPSSQVPSWKDWAKPGPYDQPVVNTLRRRKDKDAAAVVDSQWQGSAPPGQTSVSAPSPCLSQAGMEEMNPGKSGEMESHDKLALALSRGLELDTQRSSRDSIQCSSGYSTQTNTPCCSEDTIPSQGSDYDYFSMAGDQDPDQQQRSDFDKSSTIPRNSDITQSYRRMFQTKRPASTAGLPSTQPPYTGQGVYHSAPPYPTTPSPTGAYYPSSPTGTCAPFPTGNGPIIVTPGVATIRRTPSSKPSARRSGPIPIRTPVVPVKTPTVPDVAPAVNGDRHPHSPTFPVTLPGLSWSGQASTNPPSLPLSPQQHLQGQTEEEVSEQEDGNMLLAIRKGVKLKRTLTNDRSAPRIA